MHNYMNICTLLYTFSPCCLWTEPCRFKSWNLSIYEYRCLFYYPDISLGLPGHKTFNRSLINFSCKQPVIADRSAFRAERNQVLGCQNKNTLEKVYLSASFQRRNPSAIKKALCSDTQACKLIITVVLMVFTFQRTNLLSLTHWVT